MTKILGSAPDEIKYAAEILKSGGTVILPTETVYGLGANALDENAVKKIFKAKGRPSDNPLIVHISDVKQVNELVSEIPETFYTLVERFWPGPLTLVMKKSSVIPSLVSAGLDTIGIRMPSHPVALKLLAQAGVPVAAPSANISGSPSPTQVKHVISDMDGRVDAIIDGGDCNIGLESTVLDISGETPEILRPGGVTAEQLERVLEKVKVDKFVFDKPNDKSKPRSPGVKYRHYSPKAEVILFEGPLDKVSAEINRKAFELAERHVKVGILATNQTKDNYVCGHVVSCGDRELPQTIAANFFKLLRHFDEQGIDVILSEGVDKEGIGLAIMNRMVRAAGYNIVKC